MEVEVKLRLADAAAHGQLNTILSPYLQKTLHQENIFFDTTKSDLSSQRAVLRLRFLDNDTRCIASLKSRPTLVNGVSRVEEDEEELEPVIARACVEDPARLREIQSRILKRVKEEFGLGDEVGFVCLGGFQNVRMVYEWRQLKLEVDETRYAFGICYEVECESGDPEAVKRVLEEFLKENGISYSYSELSKFAVFRSGKLPIRDAIFNAFHGREENISKVEHHPVEETISKVEHHPVEEKSIPTHPLSPSHTSRH